jgi:hypothetical protein
MPPQGYFYPAPAIGQELVYKGHFRRHMSAALS